MTTLKTNMKSNIETSVEVFKSEIETSADALTTNICDLKSIMSTLKSDMATNAEKLKLKMAVEIKQCNDDVTKRVEASNVRINKVESLTKCVPELVQTVQTKLSESSEELKSIGCKVDRNKKEINELEISLKKIQDDNDGSSTLRSIQTPVQWQWNIDGGCHASAQLFSSGTLPRCSLEEKCPNMCSL